MLSRRSFLASLAVSGPSTLSPPDSSAKPMGWDPWVEIQTAHLGWNFRQIQERVARKKVMAVVKANAYGHGLAGVTRAFRAAGVNHFLVGNLSEARRLREVHPRAVILNFGPFGEADAGDIVRLGISQNVYTSQVEALDRAARRLQRRARVQIKVDTGLGRIGVPHAVAAEFLERVAALRAVTIEGIFTTFTEDPEFDAIQLARFRQITDRAAQRGFALGLRHAASSAAILDLPAASTELDMVRPGIMLYGLYPSPQAEQERKIELRPVLALKSRIAQVKTLQPGESAGYHRAYKATQQERVATLPVGYFDGYPRALAGKGSVLVAGRQCPIVAISANAAMVRLGDAPAAPGDEAVLIGAQGSQAISVAEVAQLAGTNAYGLVIGLSALLPRVYLGPKAI